jgi:hypothetical protein
MEYKKAIDVLMNLLNKNQLNLAEKGALLTAVGVLDWAHFGKNRMRNIIKARKEKLNKKE